MVAVSKSTTGLHYHVEKTHEIRIQEEATEAEPVEKKSKLGNMTSFLEKKTAEDLIAHEAAMGASFNYLTKSFLIKKGMINEGFNAPANHKSVKTYVCKSAETHRQKLIKNLKKSVQDGQRFSIITDEWTCTNKNGKYVNVNLR